MDDLVKRLRKAGFPNQSAVEMCREAADEIEALRAALEKHATTQQYVNPLTEDSHERYMCKICGKGDALAPGEIDHADGCLLVFPKAPAPKG